ncbi:MAG: riboflavin synthase [Verrucomicrobiota bacterium]
MFTGIIEKTGTIGIKRVAGKSCSLTITHERFDQPLSPGESVSVDGVCLTVTEAEKDRFHCNVLQETLERTCLGSASAGRRVNLERAVPANGRFGGHFVSGHIDCVAPVCDVSDEGGDTVLRVKPGALCAVNVVDKGSVALNGVSLTVCDPAAETFAVKIIPFTLFHTNLKEVSSGDEVNVEFDMVGKYVRRMLAEQAKDEVTEKKLRNAGFIL